MIFMCTKQPFSIMDVVIREQLSMDVRNFISSVHGPQKFRVQCVRVFNSVVPVTVRDVEWQDEYK
jgi:hypothetical protein